jgi:hypothetical protein
MPKQQLDIRLPEHKTVLEALQTVSEDMTRLCDSLTRLQLLALSHEVTNWTLTCHSYLLTSKETLGFRLERIGIRTEETK